MSYGLYVSAAGAEVQNRRLQVLSNNLANVDTPGFKREFAIVKARHSEAIERGLDFPGRRGINDVGGGVESAETVSDFTRGTLRRTNIPSDLALDRHDAFFVVQRDDQELLTRAGNFQFSADGVLRTGDGYAVLGTDGPIQIDPTLPWEVSEDGQVRQAGNTVAELRVVRPASLGDLAKAGENLFTPLAPVNDLPATERRVLSGHLEMSTVKPALEMMELIETSRAFEANVRMIQQHDQMIGALVNRILRQA